MINIILLAIQLTFGYSQPYPLPTDVNPPWVFPDAYPMGL